MITSTKKMLLTTLLFTVGSYGAWADRGVGKKNKSRIILNINAPSNIKSSLVFNLKSGLTYNGSLLNTKNKLRNSIVSSSLVTYQKGNTTYILPYKHKIAIPEIKQGYTGMKIIIRK